MYGYTGYMVVGVLLWYALEVTDLELASLGTLHYWNCKSKLIDFI